MDRRIDKQPLLRALLGRLEAELTRSTGQARDAAEGATHAEAAAEGDKDMRATEASYVARGHAERVAVLEQSIARLAVLRVRDFAPGEPIAATALVELTHDSRRSLYLLLPVAGGERLDADGAPVTTLTTTSPLGSALLGLSEGDEAEVQSPGGARLYEVSRVR